MRIGIYGGTFNPIHNGHVNLILDFKKSLNLNKVIVIPTSTPPHKTAYELASSKDRLNMCKLALENYDFCEVSDIEILRDGKSYTIDTLNQIKTHHPDDDLFLLMGEDMFLIIENWKDCEKIFSLATICSAPRSDEAKERLTEFATEIKKRHDNFKFVITDTKFMPISSTQVRNGEKDLIPKQVEDYINKNKIYRW